MGRGSRAVNFAPANRGKEKIPSPTKKSWQIRVGYKSYFSSRLGLICCLDPSTCDGARLQKEASAQEHTKDPPQLLFDTTSQS